MGFLIDTNLWIAIERGMLTAADVQAITKQKPVYLSPINLAEVLVGIELMEKAEQKQRALVTFRRMRRKPLLRITGQTAEVFARLSGRLLKAGRGSDFRVQDLWIAAQAVQRNCILLTANARDFRDIPDLKMIEIQLA